MPEPFNNEMVVDHFYLAGPMSGHPEHNFPEFRKYAKRLRDVGWKIVSPAEITEQDELPPGSRKWEEYLRQDFFQLLQCRGIVLMPGWRTSRGARAELGVADTLLMEVWNIDDRMATSFNYEYGKGRVAMPSKKGPL